jgi:hypothetical protein
MRRTLLIVLLFTLVIFGSASISYSKGTVVKLTESSLDDLVPKINDSGHVVWMGSDGNDDEIFLYDGTAITQLTNNSYDDDNPQINNSGHVVWEERDGKNSEIFLYDGNTITQLTDNPDRDIMPQINNNGQVVWLDETTRKIYLYDGNTVSELTDDASIACSNGWLPQISDNGYVVWKGFDGNTQICFYDGSTVTQLTNNSSNSSHGFSFPQISDNGHVVWEEWDGNDYEIFLYDGTAIKQVTNNSYDDINPRINDSGHVVWMGWDDHDWEIFLYDGTGITPLTNNSYDDAYARISNNDHVVWIASDGNGDELFFYGDTIITRLTNNSNGEIYVHPEVNDNGQVVWQGWDGHDFNIYLALPPVGIAVLSPNGGEALASGSVETIRWAASQQGLSFNLLYSENLGTTWRPIATSVTGNSYEWSLPVPNGNKTRCLVKVIGYSASSVEVGSDTSDTPFTIEVVRLERPSDPGISMNSRKVYNIAWTTHATIRPVETVVLYYTQNSAAVPVTWMRIASFKAGKYPDGYPWRVPELARKKTKCRVKVVLKDAYGRNVGEDVSNNNFTIKPSP